MKIAVGIPSYNEADNIQFVVSKVDQGLTILKRLFPQVEYGVIFNIDSESDDGTREVFKTTKTIWPKYSIKIYGLRGKGKNIIAFFNKITNEHFDIALTLDADLKTIEPRWIVKFTEPLINQRCDFVTPLYERNRFEGSTTNHFAYPLIYSFFGKDIRQPIAGDFALSKRLVEYIREENITFETKRYGIDIFITMQAIRFSGLVEQVKLNQKVHKPSFPKLKIMFPQVASSAIEMLRRFNFENLPSVEKETFSICVNENTNFTHSIQAESLLKEQIINLKKSIKTIAWLGNNLKVEIMDKINNSFYFDKKLWAGVLSSWFLYSLKNRERNSFKLASQLLPFFVLRTVNFWNQIFDHTPLAIENEIKRQAQLVRSRVVDKLNKTLL